VVFWGGRIKERSIATHQGTWLPVDRSTERPIATRRTWPDTQIPTRARLRSGDHRYIGIVADPRDRQGRRHCVVVILSLVQA
jgi:hypothetical protein